MNELIIVVLAFLIPVILIILLKTGVGTKLLEKILSLVIKSMFEPVSSSYEKVKKSNLSKIDFKFDGELYRDILNEYIIKWRKRKNG